MSLRALSPSHRQLSGGSGAQLQIVEVAGEMKVRKSIQGCRTKALKLSQQFEWLNARQDSEHIAKVSDLSHRDDNCHYYLHYYENYISINDYFGQTSKDSIVTTLNNVLDFSKEEIYLKPSIIQSEDLFKNYLEKKLLSKMSECSKFSVEARKILSYRQVEINGEELLNFNDCYHELINSEEIIKLNSRFKQCDIHGDLTFENILINPENGHFVLIDPNLDNVISTAAIDHAKLTQSGRSKYERMSTLQVSVSKNAITYPQDQLREDFVQEALMTILSQRMSESEIKSLDLYEAIHFSRMLPYKLSYAPHLYPIYYARMITLLNRYLSHMKT